MKNLKLLFINVRLRKNASVKILPVGLAAVMTLVDQAGFGFEFLDLDINEHEDAFVETFIRDHRFEVILLGSIVTHYKWIKWFVQMVKNYYPDTTVVVGNSVAGSCHDVFMKNVPADVAVIGEGEISCLEVLETLQSNGDLSRVTGIAYRDAAGVVHHNPPRMAAPIDALPMVDWKYFDVPRYLTPQKKLGFGESEERSDIVAMPVSTARGCVFKCSFCHYVFWNDPYRHRSPDQVLLEIRRDMETHGANYINFWDDLSFASMVQAEKMVDAILASKLKFDWMAAVRTDLFGNPRFPYEKRLAVAEKMKKAGCQSLGFSLESGNREILKMMNKKVEKEFFSEHVRVLQKVGITCNTSVVFGYPIETKETIQETFDACFENRIYPSIGFLLPLPSTGMYDYAKLNGYIKDEDAYLTSITERQDICLNMTQMSDTEIMGEITKGAQRLNDQLNLGLDEKTYIKTGGYRRHTNRKMQLEKDRPKRNENDFSFNYSDTVFEVDKGKKES